MRKQVLWILTCLALYAGAGAAEVGRTVVAVADFAGRNVSEFDAQAITEFFRSGMVATNLFSVINRNNMELVLSEQQFQLSGCTDQECVVRMGKMLNAQKIVSGYVLKFDGDYFVHANVLDVETGEIQQSEKMRCTVKSELPEKTEQLARLVSLLMTGKKRRDLDLGEKRKKFAVYACAVTPGFFMPAKTMENAVTLAYGGLDLQEGGTSFEYNIGAGVRIYPWKNIFLDVALANDIRRNVDYMVTVPLSGGNSTTQSFETEVFQTSNLDFILMYVFRSNAPLHFLAGFGYAKSVVGVQGNTYPFKTIPGYGSFGIINSERRNIGAFHGNAGVEWMPSDTLNVSLLLSIPLSDSSFSPKMKTYLSTTSPYSDSNTELFFAEIKQAPMVLKMLASYHFAI